MKKFILPIVIGVAVALVSFFGLKMSLGWHESGRHGMNNSGHHGNGGHYNNSQCTTDNDSDSDKYRYHSGERR